jgi:hypothetical protein
MPFPTADLPEPIAVLVLAWDEATPAVRALLEATQASAPTVDSILVMVPQADEPTRFSAEEYLPIELPLAEATTLAQEVDATPSPIEEEEALAETSPHSAATAIALPAEALAEEAGAAEEVPTTQPIATTSLPTPALPRAAVRVLHLGSYSLPQLASRAGQPLPAPFWVGAAALPAAPYQGSAAPVAASVAGPTDLEPLTAPGLRGPVEEAVQLVSLPIVAEGPVAQPNPLPGELTAASPLYVPAESPPQDAALETDLPPSDTDELADVEMTSPDLLQSEELPAEPAQAGWPAALASLRQPAAIPASPAPSESIPVPLATDVPAALRPVATHYPAADLNFQIIQYARFTVPVALAEPGFAVIYAPAWPTWLAAQELRQRTGRPLVLHLATLATPAGESAETAAGWMAELQRQALHRADVVLVETPALAQRLQQELGLAASTVRVVAAADAVAIAQALHEAWLRPAANPA